VWKMSPVQQKVLRIVLKRKESRVVFERDFS
jgi:hypothetical protein